MTSVCANCAAQAGGDRRNPAVIACDRPRSSALFGVFDIVTGLLPAIAQRAVQPAIL